MFLHRRQAPSPFEEPSWRPSAMVAKSAKSSLTQATRAWIQRLSFKLYACKSVERWTWMPSCWSFNTLRISVSANWSTLYFSPPLRTAVCDWSRTWCTEIGVKMDRGEKINCVDFFITWLRSSFSRPLNCVGVANSACNYNENQLRTWFRASTFNSSNGK